MDGNTGKTLKELGEEHQRATSVNISKDLILTEIDPNGNPGSMEQFIQRKKNNEPFYKSNNKRPWE